MTTFKNFIAGEWVAPATGAYFDNVNPADTTDIVGRFPKSGAEDVQRAVESAKRGSNCGDARRHPPAATCCGAWARSWSRARKSWPTS